MSLSEFLQRLMQVCADKEKIKSKYLESQWVMILITLSGGLQDAYSYCVRDHVFANAQTGNIVLMAGNLFNGDVIGAVRYLIPITAFALGVLAADQIRVRTQHEFRINSWQIAALAEALILLAVGFIPNYKNINIIANSLISFSCAVQLESFKKVNGNIYASTMCIGDLRSAMIALSKWMWSGSKKKKKEFFQYALIVLVFAAGAGAGVVLSDYLGIYTIFVSSLLMVITAIVLNF